ncbi:MAG: CoA transferase, partial [Alphaproteobacteria bacterium]|nr:CoA transferase [Alphaproteobacteria bacterium]
PYASLLLADLGADVLKVEPPAGDPQRIDGPLDKDGVSAWYKVINRGKRVLRLDLKTEAGKAAFARLIARADVLLESYRPGVLDRLDFGRAQLDALNPNLVHCALSGWGQTGPYRLKPGHDLNYMAFGGGLAISGTAQAPVMTYPSVADYAGGLFAVATCLAGLVGRRARGKGAAIDASLAETVLSWLSIDLTSMTRPGWAPARAANFYNGGLACYQIYRTADGRFLTLGVVEEKFWRNFCQAVERPDWLARQWEPVPQHALTAELAALFAAKPLAHWEQVLTPIETCYHAVVDHAELPDHPHVAARGMIARESGADPFVEVLLPAWIDGRPPPRRTALREVGADDALAAWNGTP